jgi:hypothetical protein
VRHNNFGSRVASQCSCSAGPTSPDYNNNRKVVINGNKKEENNLLLSKALDLIGGTLQMAKNNPNLPE